MKINIALPVFRRPKYTFAVVDCLHALLPLDWAVYVSIDLNKDGIANEQVVGLFSDGRWGSRKIIISIAEKPGGCNGNVFRALSLAWADSPDAVVCIEDDILVNQAAGSYLIWALEKFKNDPSVRNVALWRHLKGWMPPEKEHKNEAGRIMLQNKKFTCWGWATWAREWEGIKANWTTGGDETETSWDVVLEKYWGDRFEVAPSISRAINIGDELGTHRGGERPPALADWHSAEYWIDTPPKIENVAVISGRNGDLFMVCKHLPPDTWVVCLPEFAPIIGSLFPHLKAFTCNVKNSHIARLMHIAKGRFPNANIFNCQQNGMPMEVQQEFRNYQHFQEAQAIYAPVQ